MSDANSIWNWNSSNLEPFRRLSLRSNPTSSGLNSAPPPSLSSSSSSPKQQSCNASAIHSLLMDNNHSHNSSLSSQANSIPAANNVNNHSISNTNSHNHSNANASTANNSTTNNATCSNNTSNTSANAANLNNAINNTYKSTCNWHATSDQKYLVGYIVVCRQDLESYSHNFQLVGDRPTHDGQFGAIVEHVTPGSLANVVCKLKVGDEIVEWNGFDMRNRSAESVNQLVSVSRQLRSLRLVVVRLINSNNNSNNNNNNNNNNKINE